MYGSSTYLPAPLISIGYKPPSPHVGSTFYNPGQTESGKENLNSFISALSGLFDFVSSEERAAVEKELESYSIPEDAPLPLNEEGVDFSALANGTINEGWVKGLKAAQNAKTAISNKYSELGGDLVDFKSKLAGAGAWDTQLLLPFMKSINKVSLTAPNVTKGQIDGLGDDEVKRCCNYLGIEVNRDTLRVTINQIGDDIAQLPTVSSESLKKVTNEVGINAVMPGVGVIGANIATKNISRAQGEAYDAAEKEALDAEREEQKTENKRAARQNHERKESLARSEKAGNKNLNNQRREKK